MAELDAQHTGDDEAALDTDDARRLFEIGRALAAEQDLPRLFRQAVDATAALLPVDDVFLYVTDDAPRGALSLRACLDGGRPAAASHEADARLRAAQALQTARPAPVSPMADAPLFEAVPLTCGAHTLGCLVAVRHARGGADPFDARERLRLRWIGDYLALALQAADLAARQQHHALEILRLTEVARDSAELGLDRFIPSVTERIGRALHLDFAAVYFLESERNALVWTFGWRPDGPVSPALPSLALSTGAFFQALRTRRALRLGFDDLQLPEMAAAMAWMGLTRFAAAPLLVKDSAVGILVAGRRDRQLGDEELRLLVAFCVHVAVAADNTRLLAEAHRRAADLSVVQSVGTAMSSSLDANTVLRAAIGALQDALECDAVRVYRRRGETFESVMYRGPVLTQGDAWKWLDQQTSAIAQAISVGRAQEINPASLPESARALLRDAGLESLAAVPLLLPTTDGAAAGSSLGIVAAGRRARRPFGTSEIAMLDAVAGQLAVALRNAELFEETRQRADDLTVVNDAGRALLDGRALEETLSHAAAQIAKLVGVRTCFFLLADADRHELTGQVDLGHGHPHPLQLPWDSDTLAARAARERRPLQDRQLQEHPLVQTANVGWTPRWTIALPFGTTDQVLGVMLLVDSDPRRELKQAEIDRVMAVGNQVAIAIDRARLTARLAESVTELEEAQAQLVRRERLAALGGLAALVAHEVRNPLGVISNSLGLLPKLTDLSGDAARAVEIIREETGRIDKIVNDMLDYARPLEARLVPGRLDRVVSDAIASATAAERSRGTKVDAIAQEVAADSTLPLVAMDERLLHQALVNLLSNAYQSLNGPGTVRVEVRREPDGSRAAIVVADDGPGMDDEAKVRLFEPFFTTKAKGSGLGLAVVKRILDGHRWDIALDTQLGRGTRFTITLPLPEA